MTKVAAALVFGTCSLAMLGFKQQPNHVHKFSELPGGHILKIDLQTRGCFEQNANYFIFYSRPKPMLDIAGFPTQTLSASDIKGLDKLLSFYRHVKEGYCTTTDKITIEEYSGNTLLARESYVDSTCSTINEKDLFSLRTLIERAYDLKKRQP